MQQQKGTKIFALEETSHWEHLNLAMSINA
jgi:hypothetical protein